MSERPTVCMYCRGTGRSDEANECGFCDHGTPLDTQEDWDQTWGRTFANMDNRPERAPGIRPIEKRKDGRNG
jgi:hypothetical protein